MRAAVPGTESEVGRILSRYAPADLSAVVGGKGLVALVRFGVNIDLPSHAAAVGALVRNALKAWIIAWRKQLHGSAPFRLDSFHHYIIKENELQREKKK